MTPKPTDSSTKAPEDRTEDILDTLFGDPPQGDTKPVTPPSEEPLPEKDTILPVEDSGDDDDDTDYDAPIKAKVDDATDDDDDAAIKDETMARKIAKERGREAKQLKAALTERELEVERERTEREKIQARLDELEATRVNPREHPDFVALQSEVLSDASNVARRLPGRAKILMPKNFGLFMEQYIATSAAEGDEVLEADEKLAGVIAEKLELTDTPYSDLDEDEREALRPTIEKVIDVLERNLGKTRQLEELHAKLSERAKSGSLSMSVREYERNVAEFAPVFDAIGDLPEEVIEADPYSIESVVARMIKESPEAAKRFANVKRDVLEVYVGPRVLTQAEIDKLEANGTDMKAFLVERNKAARAKQKKLAAFFVHALMTRSLFKEKLTKLAELQSTKDAEEDEFDAIRRVKKKVPGSVIIPEKTTPRKPGSSLDKLFGPEE